jgi:DMSO reductase family type II enzyme heme b subunit
MKVPLIWRALVRAWLVTGCLSFLESLSPALSANAPEPVGVRGQVTYEQHCAACHGLNGDGNGPAAVWLYPKPRDFSAALFKIKSTAAQALPTDDDLLQSVTRGLPGSSMPSFSYLPLQERRDLVHYVKFLSARTEPSGRRLNVFEEAAATGALARPVEVPPEPAASVQELTLGREVYQRMQCALCHGETGAGDGPQVPTLKDAAGIPVRPRDFNTGLFRGGHSGRDLYLRIHNGMPGTPMIPYGSEVMKPEERWALVHYIQSLRRTDVAVNDLLTPEDGAIHAQHVAKLPTDPLESAWESLDPVRVPLNPLWPEPRQIYAVAVSAMSDGERLALLLQWRDELPQNSAIRIQDFQDAAAVQFSLSTNYGFLGMGDAKNPVNLWQWKAGWQAEAEGRGPDMQSVYNSMHVDAYLPTNFNTALAAGNVISQPHQSPIEDANARGFGSFKSQPLAQQNVTGKGVWHDGFWNVVFVRDLKSKDGDDVKFAPGPPVPVAFAIWNGEQQDRNGRKMISNWYQLIIDEPKSTAANR